MENPLTALLNEQVKQALQTALSEVPVLRDLLEGKPVELVTTIQLRKKEG